MHLTNKIDQILKRIPLVYFQCNLATLCTHRHYKIVSNVHTAANWTARLFLQ